MAGPKNLEKPFTEAPPDSEEEENENDVQQQPQIQPQNDDDDDSSSSSDASSSDDDETQKHPKKTTMHSSEEEEEDDDEGEDEEEQEQPPIVKKPQNSMTAKSASKPRFKPVGATAEKEKRPLEDNKKSVSSEEEEDDNDNDEGEEEEEQKQPAVIKKPSKSASKPKSKRPLEEDKQKSVSSKKPRKEDKEEKETEEGLSKKQAIVPFQKLFSDEDEIVILKGMINYKLKKGVDAMTDLNDFCGFIKNSLECDYDKKQIIDKVRRFRKKFYKVNKKLITPHDLKILELSKKIWKKAESVGDEGNVNGGKSSSKQSGVVMEVEIGEDLSKEKLRRKGMELIGEKVRCELSQMWDKVSLAQMKVDQMRFKVLKEESKRIVEALKSGKQ